MNTIAIALDEEYKKPKSPLCDHSHDHFDTGSESTSSGEEEEQKGEFECVFCNEYTDDAYKCNSCNNHICCDCVEDDNARCDNHIGFPYGQDEAPTDIFCSECLDWCIECRDTFLCFECHDVRDGLCYACIMEKSDQFVCYTCEEVDKYGVLCLCGRFFCDKCKSMHMTKCKDEGHKFEGKVLVCDWCQVKCCAKNCDTCAFCVRENKCTSCFYKKDNDLMSEGVDEDVDEDNDMSE